MKTSELIQKILFCFFIPIITGITVYFLIPFLPDSYRILTQSVFGYFFSEIACIFFLFFEEKKIFRYFARILFFCSILMSINLNFSVFYIYHISKILTIFLLLFYFAIAIVICVFSKKQKIFVYLWIFVSIIIAGFFNYIAIVSLIYSKQLYAVFLVLASFIFLSLVFYYMIDLKQYHFKHSKVVRFILLIISQLLLSAAAVFMIC